MDQQYFVGNKEDLELLLHAIDKNDPSIWNDWKRSGSVSPNLEGIDLSNKVLHGFNFENTNLQSANLNNCKITSNFSFSNLNHSNLKNTFLWRSIFIETTIMGATIHNSEFSNSRIQASDFSISDIRNAKFDSCDLEDTCFLECEIHFTSFQNAFLLQTSFKKSHCSSTSFMNANLKHANFSWARIIDCDFTSAILNSVNLCNATLKYCRVYGVAAWDLNLDNCRQGNFIVSKENEPVVSVDDIDVSQFIHLLISNHKIRNVINTTTSKVALILGRFYKERKIILDHLHGELRKKGMVPIIFDFDPSQNRDLTETVQILASMSKFVIADITDAKSIPQELSHIVPFFPSIPVQPILLATEKAEYSMFEHWLKFNSVLPIFYYEDKDHLIDSMEKFILQPIEDFKDQEANASKAKKQVRKLEELKRNDPVEYQKLKEKGYIL